MVVRKVTIHERLLKVQKDGGRLHSTILKRIGARLERELNQRDDKDYQKTFELEDGTKVFLVYQFHDDGDTVFLTEARLANRG